MIADAAIVIPGPLLELQGEMMMKVTHTVKFHGTDRTESYTFKSFLLFLVVFVFQLTHSLRGILR